MKIGINGMGRIGRLAFRAALGGAHRGSDDPRAGHRLEIAHVNEIKAGPGPLMHPNGFIPAIDDPSILFRSVADIAAWLKGQESAHSWHNSSSAVLARRC